MARATKRLELVGGIRNRSVCGSRLGRGALHTMAVLQAHQEDLLKDLDEGKGLSPEAMEELHHRSRSPCCQENCCCHRPGDGAVVATESQQWLNLVDIGRKEKNLFLDAPFSLSGLFGTSVEALLEKFREVRVQSADSRDTSLIILDHLLKALRGLVRLDPRIADRSRAHRRHDVKETRGDLRKVIEKRYADSRHSVSNSP